MRGSRPVSIVSHFLVTLEIKLFLLLNQLGLFSVWIFKRARPALNPIIKMISFPISPHFFFFSLLLSDFNEAFELSCS